MCWCMHDRDRETPNTYLQARPHTNYIIKKKKKNTNKWNDAFGVRIALVNTKHVLPLQLQATVTEEGKTLVQEKRKDTQGRKVRSGAFVVLIIQ